MAEGFAAQVNVKLLTTRGSFLHVAAAVILAAAFSAPALAGSRATRPHAPLNFANLPFEPVEELVYEAEFSKLLLRGIQIAEFRFTSKRAPATGDEGAPAPLLFTGDVVSRGFFRKLFGINFRYRVESVVDPTTLNVLRNRTLDEQGKRVRAAETVFDWGENQVTWTERDPNDPRRAPRVVRSPLAGPVQDLLTAVYFLRAKPLAPGASFEMQLSDSGKVYRVPVTVHAESKKFKSAVGRVRVVRVEMGMFGEGRPLEGEGRVTLWVSDDARRLPVRARISSDIGTLDISLKSINGARRG